MADPMSAEQLLAALRAEGVRYVEEPGWPTHNRNHIGLWGPVYGVVWHHTAGNSTPTWLLRNGRPDLPGPLCLIHVPRDGVAHLVGLGRANHAGTCDRAVLAAVIEERPAPPPQRDEVDFNRYTYGIEVNGTDDGQPWTPEQVDTCVRVGAAISRVHGWGPRSHIGHREATRRKPLDPSGIAMDELRRLIDQRLQGPPGQDTSPPPAVEEDAVTPEDFDKIREITRAEIQQAIGRLPAAVWAHQLPDPAEPGKTRSAALLLGYTRRHVGFLLRASKSVADQLRAGVPVADIARALADELERRAAEESQ